MDKIIFVWDDGEYARRLRDKCRENAQVVTSKGELDAKLKSGREQSWDDVCLVVLLELAWEGQRSHFHGFELVKELLLDDFSGPILLCSYLEKKRFYSVQGIGRFLAQMPFPFVQLPVAPKALEEEAQGAEAFSPMLRAYVRENYLAQEPFGRIAHDLRQALDKNDANMKRTVRNLLEDLDELEARLPGPVAEQRQAVEQALQQDGAIDAARVSIDKLRRRLKEHGAPQHDSEAKEENAAAKSGYAIMLVEDDYVQREQYRRGLAPYFDVFAAESADEALNELRTSERTYLAVVADWVLLEEDGVTWQPMQGFDLLVKAWEESGPLCLIALTSLHREAVASVLRSASHEIDWFSKSEVGDDARWPFHAFAGYLRKRVRALLSDLESMPQGKWWTEKGLGDLFLELKYESGRWEQVRTDAEETARQIVEEFFEEESALAPVNKGDYKLKTPGGKTTPKMHHLEKILSLRLAVLAGHFKHNLPPLKIRRLLHKEPDLDESKMKNRASGWYSKLGPERDNQRIPEASIMEHERDWLQRTYDLDLKKVELEEQAKAGGTEHQSMATELNTLCTEIGGIMWSLNEKYEDAPSGYEVETINRGMDALEAATRWAKNKRSSVKKFLKAEIQQLLDDSGYEQVLKEFGRLDDVEAYVDSLRE